MPNKIPVSNILRVNKPNRGAYEITRLVEYVQKCRNRAVLLSDAADFMGVSLRTVQRWCERAEEAGGSTLRREAIDGRVFVVSGEARAETHTNDPIAHWTAARTAVHFELSDGLEALVLPLGRGGLSRELVVGVVLDNLAEVSVIAFREADVSEAHEEHHRTGGAADVARFRWQAARVVSADPHCTPAQARAEHVVAWVDATMIGLFENALGERHMSAQPRKGGLTRLSGVVVVDDSVRRIARCWPSRLRLEDGLRAA